MTIVYPTDNQESITPLFCTHIDRNGKESKLQQELLIEHSLFVDLTDESPVEFTCMSDHLPELIIGHLLSEAYIQNVNEIMHLSLNSEGTHATVTFNCARSMKKHVFTPLPPKKWDLAQVFHLADAFAGEMPLHNLTNAAHSCFLAYRGDIVFACEDLGRHNALDKAIGYAALQGYKPADCILYSSGRMPTDMVSKAIRAGFPVLISKGSPTANAVELARKFGLTLICSARRDGVKIYSDGR